MRGLALPGGGAAGPAQFASYLVVGGITFVCYFALLALFNELGLAYPAAVAIAYGAAIAVHFGANRLVTFRAAAVPARRQLGRYLVLVIVNYLVQVAVLGLTYDLLGWNYYLGAFLGILVTLTVGFLVLKEWVFSVPGPVDASHLDKDA